MNKIIKVADVADVIINGCAFTRDGSRITVENMGTLTEREVRIIREFIKENYKDMYLKWGAKSDSGFYGE